MRNWMMAGLGLALLAGASAAGADTPEPAVTGVGAPDITTTDMADLRRLYAGPPESWPRPTLLDGAVFTEFGPLPAVADPAGNPSTPEKVALGKQLFDDPILSGSGQIACSNCHNPELGWGDGLRSSFGHDRQRGARNAPTLIAVAHRRSFFWDGRAASLEEQAKGPMTNPIEMNGQPADIEARVNGSGDYPARFAAIFGPGPVTLDQIAMALAAYERTIKPRPGKWDRALAKGTQTLSDQELQGLHLFRTKAGCANCHNGPLFSDEKFHNLGLSFYGRERQDLGRYAVTGKAEDVGAFRTPSLRGIAGTGPYMHNGLFPSLENIVDFYNAGGARPRPTAAQAQDPLFPTTTPLLRKLGLTKPEREALEAFLRTL